MTRIALNGLGRIGKLVLRDLIDTGAAGEIVLLNDPVGDAEQHALLIEFDSVHGRWRTPVAAAAGALVLNGQTIRLTHEKAIEALPLADCVEVTEIEQDFDGDAVAPALGAEWVAAARSRHVSTKGLPFSFVTYRRAGV